MLSVLRVPAVLDKDALTGVLLILPLRQANRAVRLMGGASRPLFLLLLSMLFLHGKEVSALDTKTQKVPFVGPFMFSSFSPCRRRRCCSSMAVGRDGSGGTWCASAGCGLSTNPKDQSFKGRQGSGRQLA